MHKQTLYRLLILGAIVIGAYLNYKWHHRPPKLEAKPVYNMVIRDSSGNVAFKSTDNFYFKHSDYKLVNPISDSIQKVSRLLQHYLAQEKEKNIRIVGQYHPDETNTSALPNLGLARAVSVKNFLIEKGVEAQQIDVAGEASPILQSIEGFINGPLHYTIIRKMDKTKEYEALKQRILADPLVVHFESGQSNIDLDTVQRQKVADILRYLDKVAGASCRIIGHTDNRGNEATNIKLGLERAAMIKTFLVNNGLNENKVLVESLGSESPIANNATAEGRAKNRRTEITFNDL